MLLWRTVSASPTSSSASSSPSSLSSELPCRRPRLRLKVGVMGASATGKSALLVRFLTNRFIGEYHSGSDLNYEHVLHDVSHTDVNNNNVNVDDEEHVVMVDFCDFSTHQSRVSLPPESVSLDGLLLVYSIVDRVSFEAAKAVLAELRPGFVGHVLLVANKTDLTHCAKVSRTEGEALAEQFRVTFTETSAAEQGVEVATMLHQWLSFVHKHRRARLSSQSIVENCCAKSGRGRRHSLVSSSKCSRKSSMLWSAMGNLLLNRANSNPNWLVSGQLKNCQNMEKNDEVNCSYGRHELAFRRILKKRSV